MTRISIVEWGLQLAEVTALRVTCLRRSVGCVLLDRAGRVLATGYNGVARGLPHCNDVGHYLGELRKIDIGRQTTITNMAFPHACKGAGLPSGTGLDLCEAVHAEQNALTQCVRPDDVWTCCVTTSPCVHCVKMLMNTGCREIAFREEYTQREARDLWLFNARETERMWNWVKK